MQKQYLHENWQMEIVGKDGKYHLTIPGSVYSALLDAGKMEDPFWRDNELEALKLMENDFEFTSSFTVCPELFDSDAILVRFDGLDTICDIYLNDEKLDSCNNMHRTYEYDVTDLLTTGENTLKIVFHSPTEYIKDMYKACKADGSSDAMEGFAHIRKTHCMFGWDWGPRLPDAGIWRDVSLLGISKGRIDSCYVRQNHFDGKVELGLEVDVDYVCHDELSYTATITAPDGTEFAVNDEDKVLIEKPELWWPHGYGEQPLYTVTVYLLDGEDVLDVWEKKIGLRTMTMHMDNDEHGQCFAHCVNGVDIFAMGADYIPEDNIFSRVTPERTRELLEQCTAANFNCVRVWGGGHYPSDEFFDYCDELGLVVWQDFMFACAVYELTPEFHDNIKEEIIDNVKRIRHHASLGLWCGNNEMEMFVDFGTWVSSPKQKADYIRMYEYLIPSILKDHDPETFYWPASPSSGGGFDKPNDDKRGDVHYWEVWHGNKPFSEYRKHNFRYVSEFGFESFPSLKTVESFTLPEDRNVFSYVMEKHQRCNGANGKILNYLSQTFKMPNNFDDTLYASQLLQGEGIKYGVEHFRRIRGICMGAIYWQLNDCWPVASWASVDYFGRWKALHYYAKRFFAPLMISCAEEGMITQDSNINAEPYAMEKSIRLSVANETMFDKTLKVKWALRDNYSNIKKEGEEEVFVEKLSSKWLQQIDMPEADMFKDYVSFSLYDGDKEISDGTVIFSFPKYFEYINPELTATVDGDEITVTASAYAKSVEILNENEDLILSDNYFDLNKGSKTVKIIKGDASKLRLRSVYNIGR